MGAEAAPAAGALVGCLKDADHEVRTVAAAALARIGEPAVKPLDRSARGRRTPTPAASPRWGWGRSARPARSAVKPL